MSSNRSNDIGGITTGSVLSRGEEKYVLLERVRVEQQHNELKICESETEMLISVIVCLFR